MPASKLEKYQAILEVLAKKPLKIDRLAYKLGFDCEGLRKNLGFLIEQGLVKEISVPTGTLYSVTNRGVAVSETLESQKYLKRMEHTVTAIDQSIAKPSQEYRDNEKE
jgi:predicted transcriptional regulator